MLNRIKVDAGHCVGRALEPHTPERHASRANAAPPLRRRGVEGRATRSMRRRVSRPATDRSACRVTPLFDVSALGMRVYQAWYRDSATYCIAATFNPTNGWRIDWQS